MKALRGVLTNKVTRDAIIYSLLLLLVYRLGSFIVTPGIDSAAVLESSSMVNNELSSLFNFFGGGSIGQMSLFALGVSPYITSSIVIQLLENELVPSMNEWKHQGVDGQNKRSNWTKYLAILFAFVQSIGIAFGFFISTKLSIIEDNNYFVVALIMTAGTAILMWLSDRITEKGIGNGISVLIMVGIISQIPKQFNDIYALVINSSGKDLAQEILVWIIITIITLIVIIMVIYYNLAYRKIPINYVRSGKSTIRKNSYLPIKLNPAGVIPVIFAGPFMLIMKIIVEFACDRMSLFTNDGTIGVYENTLRSIFGGGDYWGVYILVYSTLIILFSIFYSYIQMNPENMTENLEKQSAYIIGVRPGEDTLNYFSRVINRTTLWGGLILAFIAILPILIQKIGDININLSLLGTGLIIVVSVLVQTFQSLTNKVESKKYRKLLGE